MDAKALLDSLMGPSRNVSDKDKTGEDFKAKDVCKDYLVGFCPRNNLFSGRVTGQRKQLGICNKVHSNALRGEFQRHPNEKYLRREYEEAYLRTLSNIAAEADQCVAREKRAARPAGTIMSIPESLKPKVERLEEEYKKLLEKADVNGSEEAMRQADAVKEQLVEIKKEYKMESSGEEVCEICGIKYAIGDELCQMRADQHFSGKMHEGYSKIRQAIADLKEKALYRQENPSPETIRKAKESKNEKEGDKDSKRHSRGDRDGDHGREERARDERGRDDRGRRRERSRDRREPSREGRRRSRSRSEGRRRSRSRDRGDRRRR